MTNQKQLLDISWETILKISFIGLVFYFIFLLKDIFVWILFALIISILFNPAIYLLKKIRIPRFLGLIFIYLSIFGILALIIYLTAPIFIFEIKQFYQSFPRYLGKINPFLEIFGLEALENKDDLIKVLIERLEQGSAGIFNALFAFFGGIGSTIFILTLSFFFSLEEKLIERILILFIPKKYEESALAVFKKCQRKVSIWFGVRVLVSLFVSAATFLVLFLLNVKYALILAFLAGITNFIPYLGPAVMGVLLFLIIFSTDTFFKAVVVLIIFILIQQVENGFISPVLMKKFIGLPPALVLISLVIGGKALGFLGAIFAVPVAGILYEFLTDFLKKKKKEEPVIL